MNTYLKFFIILKKKIIPPYINIALNSSFSKNFSRYANHLWTFKLSRKVIFGQPSYPDTFSFLLTMVVLTFSTKTIKSKVAI